jgi:hypothetical protein
MGTTDQESCHTEGRKNIEKDKEAVGRHTDGDAWWSDNPHKVETS